MTRTMKRRDAGFSIFYMGINLGAFIAPLVVGTLGPEGSIGMWGSAAPGVGMVAGLIQYVVGPAASHAGVAAAWDKTDKGAATHDTQPEPWWHFNAR